MSEEVKQFRVISRKDVPDIGQEFLPLKKQYWGDENF